MPDVIIVYWRDIPAQVIVGRGRRAAKEQLSERFQIAIDRCAMKVGARDADVYLADWRKSAARHVEGNAGEVAKAEAARLECDYDATRIGALVENEGRA